MKQGLPFDDALPGTSHEAEHPWYDSAEQTSSGGTITTTNLPSSRIDSATGNFDERTLGDDSMEHTGRLVFLDK